jgi:hypothetical protein
MNPRRKTLTLVTPRQRFETRRLPYTFGDNAQFDSPKYWVFERNSRLPLSTFRKPKPSPDAIVFAVCIIGCLLVVALTRVL